ncbi:Kinesin-like protein KIFC3, partial [Cynara cardunculus var. scolymus]
MKQEQTQLSCDAREYANLIPDMDNMISAIQGQVAQCEDLKQKYNEELVKRRKLYNQIQEAKGKFSHSCRPLDKHEVSAGHAMVVDLSASKDGDLGIVTVDVFADASPVVMSVLDGYNCARSVQQAKQQSLEVKAKCKDQMQKGQQEKLDDLAGQLELKSQLCKQLEKQTSPLSDEVMEVENKLKERTQMFELKLSASKEKIKKLENRLERQDDHTSSLMPNQK